jgi:hypothetical protein
MTGKKRDFLKPVSVLAALLLSGTAQSKAATNDQAATTVKPASESLNITEKELLVLAPENQVRSPNQHSSHSSHASHRSHMSSYK